MGQHFRESALFNAGVFTVHNKLFSHLSYRDVSSIIITGTNLFLVINKFD